MNQPTRPANPHDRTFRKAMRDMDVAQEFLAQHLPQDIQKAIDKGSLQIRDSSSFIDERLLEKLTDVLYEVRFDGEPGYVNVLIEHKAHQEDIRLWALKAEVDIMVRHQQTHPKQPLPLIYTILVYHGEKPYRYSLDIRELVSAPKHLIDAYFLRPPHLVDLTTIEDKELQKHFRVGLLQFMLKHIYASDILPDLRRIMSLMRDVEQLGGKDAMFVETLIYYVASTGKINDLAQFKQLIEVELPETGEKMMGTVFEALRKEGGEKVRLQLAERMLKDKVSLEMTSRYTDLPIATLRALQETKETVC